MSSMWRSVAAAPEATSTMAIGQALKTVLSQGTVCDFYGLSLLKIISTDPLLDVIIEFGHNDGGSPKSSATADVNGDDDSVETVTLANGTVEVVHTFG
jgi:hypothetical protein